MVNKPKGFICTVSDEKDRKTVMELVPQKYKDKRLFPVGRLDYDTEGLLLMTTDGDFCNRLMHPRNEIPKTYAARIEGDITEDELNKIRAGVILDGRKTNRCKAKVVAADGKVSRVEIVISEGRNRQVRRMFEAINREVVFLKRVAIGDIRLGGLGRGLVRELTPDEVEYLRRV
jgi:23S rRNA pseudouridine2605 synthase